MSDRASDAFIVEDRLQSVTRLIDKLDFQAKVQGTMANSSIMRFDPQLTFLGSNTGASPLSSLSIYVTSDWLQVA